MTPTAMKPPRTGAVKRMIIAAYEADPAIRPSVISRRLGTSDAYVSRILIDCGRPRQALAKQRAREIVRLWRTGRFRTYSELSAHVGMSRYSVSKALRRAGVDRSGRKGKQAPVKAARIIKLARTQPLLSNKEIAARVGASSAWVSILMRRHELRRCTTWGADREIH